MFYESNGIVRGSWSIFNGSWIMVSRSGTLFAARKPYVMLSCRCSRYWLNRTISMFLLGV